MKNIYENNESDAILPASLTTAVLFMVFNRPNETSRVFDIIRAVRPSRLYVASDGPRNKEDDEKVKKVRQIATQVDWDCEVKTLFRSENLGCGKAPSEAISWFFDNEEEGIILEDDCLPSQSFFFYCQDLLCKYRNDMRVWHIAGNNFDSPDKIFNNSSSDYVFASFPQVWGWATWKRAWLQYDYQIKTWPSVKQARLLERAFPNKISYYEKSKQIDMVYGGKKDIWDYQWHYMILSNHALVIVPTKNLVSNIGYGQDATHTPGFSKGLNNLPVHELSFPLKHPDVFAPLLSVDRFYAKKMGMSFSLKRQIKRLLKILLN